MIRSGLQGAFHMGGLLASQFAVFMQGVYAVDEAKGDHASVSFLGNGIMI